MPNVVVRPALAAPVTLQPPSRHACNRPLECSTNNAQAGTRIVVGVDLARLRPPQSQISATVQAALHAHKTFDWHGADAVVGCVLDLLRGRAALDPRDASNDEGGGSPRIAQSPHDNGCAAWFSHRSTTAPGMASSRIESGDCATTKMRRAISR